MVAAIHAKYLGLDLRHKAWNFMHFCNKHSLYHGSTHLVFLDVKRSTKFVMKQICLTLWLDIKHWCQGDFHHTKADQSLMSKAVLSLMSSKSLWHFGLTSSPGVKEIFITSRQSRAWHQSLTSSKSLSHFGLMSSINIWVGPLLCILQTLWSWHFGHFFPLKACFYNYLIHIMKLATLVYVVRIYFQFFWPCNWST